MKKYYLTLNLLLFLTSSIFAQFTNPFGYTGYLNSKLKHINEGSHGSGASFRAIKWTTSNRRYNLNVKFYDNTWHTQEENCGWNKVARISFVRSSISNPHWGDYYKLHIGWRPLIENNKLRLSAYYHDADYTYFVAHSLDTINTDTEINTDLFLGHNIISIIIDNKALGLRKMEWIPDNKRSYLAKTFYFGGVCNAPHYMEAYLSGQSYDFSGYGTKFNSQDLMIWNLTEFEDGDNFDYFSKVIFGSIDNPNKVQYHTDHPNKEYQKCVVHNNSNISFNANERVVLYPGFHAKNGSVFSALIVNPPALTIESTPTCFAENILYSVNNAKSMEFQLFLDEHKDSIVYSGQVYEINFNFDLRMDTVLPNLKYFAVANFYSGKGNQKRVEGYVTNSLYGLKQNTTSTFNIHNLVNCSIYPTNTKIETINTSSTNFNFVIFPNPTNGANFSIRFNKLIDNKINIIIFNTLGVECFRDEIYSSLSKKYDELRMKKGIYILNISVPSIGFKRNVKLIIN